MLLAGLISDQQNSTRSGIPGLLQFKFLGDLLSSHDTSSTRDELIVFIRPQIISNAADAEQVSKEFRDRLLSMQQHQH